jgi:glycosyltransferase involved in cell wall biosynthesis
MASFVALLGHTHKPTCGVEDYCTFLRQALGAVGVDLELMCVRWAQTNWRSALFELWHASSDWRERWVVLQYTAGAWSRYGFPFGAILVMAMLRYRGARCAVMFHEPYAWEVPPADWLDRVRAVSQNCVIRALYYAASKAIFADPIETITWLPEKSKKAIFIPIGGNIPEPATCGALMNRSPRKTVAVFCLSDPPRQQQELEEIWHAVRMALSRIATLRLVLVGKGTAEAREHVEQIFAGVAVEVQNLGIRSSEEVSKALAEADAMLCVRGRLFARRGSALAGIACGVPVIAYDGPAQQTPIAEAGVEFVPYGDRDALGAALIRVLTDEKLQAELRARNRRGQERYFSWKSIARRHTAVFGLPTATLAGTNS